MNLDGNSPRLRRNFVRAAFASVAGAATGAGRIGAQAGNPYTSPSPAEEEPLAQSRRMHEYLPDRYTDKFRITKLETFKVTDGHIPLPTKPGLGIELDDDAMADKLGHDWKNPETYLKSDGSVVERLRRNRMRFLRTIDSPYSAKAPKGRH